MLYLRAGNQGQYCLLSVLQQAESTSRYVVAAHVLAPHPSIGLYWRAIHCTVHDVGELLQRSLATRRSALVLMLCGATDPASPARERAQPAARYMVPGTVLAPGQAGVVKRGGIRSGTTIGLRELQPRPPSTPSPTLSVSSAGWERRKAYLDSNAVRFTTQRLAPRASG